MDMHTYDFIASSSGRTGTATLGERTPSEDEEHGEPMLLQVDTPLAVEEAIPEEVFLPALEEEPLPSSAARRDLLLLRAEISEAEGPGSERRPSRRSGASHLPPYCWKVSRTPFKNQASEP